MSVEQDSLPYYVKHIANVVENALEQRNLFTDEEVRVLESWSRLPRIAQQLFGRLFGRRAIKFKLNAVIERYRKMELEFQDRKRKYNEISKELKETMPPADDEDASVAFGSRAHAHLPLGGAKRMKAARSRVQMATVVFSEVRVKKESKKSARQGNVIVLSDDEEEKRPIALSAPPEMVSISDGSDASSLRSPKKRAKLSKLSESSIVAAAAATTNITETKAEADDAEYSFDLDAPVLQGIDDNRMSTWSALTPSMRKLSAPGLLSSRKRAASTSLTPPINADLSNDIAMSSAVEASPIVDVSPLTTISASVDTPSPEADNFVAVTTTATTTTKSTSVRVSSARGAESAEGDEYERIVASNSAACWARDSERLIESGLLMELNEEDASVRSLCALLRADELRSACRALFVDKKSRQLKRVELVEAIEKAPLGMAREALWEVIDDRVVYISEVARDTIERAQHLFYVVMETHSSSTLPSSPDPQVLELLDVLRLVPFRVGAGRIFASRRHFRAYVSACRLEVYFDTLYGGMRGLPSANASASTQVLERLRALVLRKRRKKLSIASENDVMEHLDDDARSVVWAIADALSQSIMNVAADPLSASRSLTTDLHEVQALGAMFKASLHDELKPIFSVADIGSNTSVEDRNDEKNTVILPCFLHRFTNTVVLLRLFTHALQSVERARLYAHASVYYRLLLACTAPTSYASRMDTHSFVPLTSRRRGFWYERLCVHLEHCGRKAEALKVCEIALKDASVTRTYEIVLQNRFKRLYKTRLRFKDPKFDREYKEPKERIFEGCINIRSGIGARVLVRPVRIEKQMRVERVGDVDQREPKQKRVRKEKEVGYEDDEYDDDAESNVEEAEAVAETVRNVGQDDHLCTIEEYALQRYAEADGGAWHGVHDEGRTLRTLCMLILWPQLFRDDIDGVFLSRFQASPLDFGHAVFYANRRADIDALLDEVSKLSPRELFLLIADRFDSYCGQLCRMVDWTILGDRDRLAEAAMCVGGRALTRLTRRFCGFFRAGGMPDLFLWNPARQTCLLSEVKSPNDRLMDTQRMWLEALREDGIDCEVCLIEYAKRRK